VFQTYLIHIITNALFLFPSCTLRYGRVNFLVFFSLTPLTIRGFPIAVLSSSLSSQNTLNLSWMTGPRTLYNLELKTCQVTQTSNQRSVEQRIENDLGGGGAPNESSLVSALKTTPH